MSLRRRIGIALAAATVALSAAAVEPDGYVRFTPRWSAPDGVAIARPAPGTPAVLKIDLAGPVRLRDVVLDAVLPAGMDASSPAGAAGPTFFEVAPRGGARVLRADLGGIPAGTPATVVLEVRVPEEGGGGILSFELRATGASGETVRDGLGVVVGRPEAEARRRHGAVEFRATPQPGEPPR